MLVHQLMCHVKTVVRGKNGSAVRPWLWASRCTIALFCILPIPTHSQTIDQCDQSSLRTLEFTIRLHNDDGARADYKFTDIWYYQGPLPKEATRSISLKQIVADLNQLGNRRSALLFHWVDDKRLWTWLITSDGRKVCAMPRTLTPDDWETLDANNWSVLGARGARQARAVFEDAPSQDEEAQRPRWAELLERMSKILLPTEVIAELKSSNSDTLVVVPITVIQPQFSVKGPLNEQTINIPPIRMTLSLSTVPFAALPFENGKLIDRFSIVMSPGFTSFTKDPKEVNKQFKDPIVIGNPASPAYPNLPGAEDEAKHVADRLGTRVFVRKAATKKVLETYLRQHSASVDLIHLATHGIANAKHPLDKSVLVFSDTSWSARDIGKLRLTRKPLVVMSACQTALGKNFPSGTIGLAQAWQRAGASNVVMSLWSVDDTATKELMVQFVDLVASGQAVDKALQAAMVSLRDRYPNPSNWASFSIYGAPERIGVTAAPSSSTPGKG